MDEIQYAKWDYARQTHTQHIHYSYSRHFVLFFWQFFWVYLALSFSHRQRLTTFHVHAYTTLCMCIDTCTLNAPYIFITKVHNQQKGAHSTIIACYSYLVPYAKHRIDTHNWLDEPTTTKNIIYISIEDMMNHNLRSAQRIANDWHLSEAYHERSTRQRVNATEQRLEFDDSQNWC